MKNLLFYTLLSTIICLSACKKNEQKTETPELTTLQNNQQQAIQAQTALEEAANPPVIITADGEKFGSIIFGKDKVVIDVNNQNILVHKRKEDKRKYEVDGTIVSEVKYNEDGFKLRTADGQLKWKVKFDDKKTKISDNEENNNPFELKIYETSKAKIKQNDKQIAEVTEVVQTVIIKTSKKTYQIEHENFNKAYAILGVEDIMPQDRLILLLELILYYASEKPL